MLLVDTMAELMVQASPEHRFRVVHLLCSPALVHDSQDPLDFFHHCLTYHQFDDVAQLKSHLSLNLSIFLVRLIGTRLLDLGSQGHYL